MGLIFASNTGMSLISVIFLVAWFVVVAIVLRKSMTGIRNLEQTHTNDEKTTSLARVKRTAEEVEDLNKKLADINSRIEEAGLLADEANLKIASKCGLGCFRKCPRVLQFLFKLVKFIMALVKTFAVSTLVYFVIIYHMQRLERAGFSPGDRTIFWHGTFQLQPEVRFGTFVIYGLGIYGVALSPTMRRWRIQIEKHRSQMKLKSWIDELKLIVKFPRWFVFLALYLYGLLFLACYMILPASQSLQFSAEINLSVVFPLLLMAHFQNYRRRLGKRSRLWLLQEEKNILIDEFYMRLSREWYTSHVL